MKFKEFLQEASKTKGIEYKSKDDWKSYMKSLGAKSFKTTGDVERVYDENGKLLDSWKNT